MMDKGLSRRRFTQSLGIVVAPFALAPHAVFGQAPGTLPFSLRNNRRLDGWIRLEPDETVTVFTGKAELGQGVLTALVQIAAEELDIGFDQIHMVSAGTSRGPDEAVHLRQSIGRAKWERYSVSKRRGARPPSGGGGMALRDPHG
jgi:nicotinate dehydrogenase subunit B